MIRPLDALRLASTKLRTRKIRTGFTVAIAGLLFGLVMAVTLISDGVFQSLDRMMQQSMTGRYIISGTQPYGDTSHIYRDKELILQAQAAHKQLVAEKKAEAKRLGIEYDPASDPSPVETYDGEQSLSYSSPIAQKIIDEALLKTSPAPTLAEFQQLGSKYHATKYYQVEPLVAKEGSLVEMKEGKEELATTDNSKIRNQNGAPADLQEMSLVPSPLLSSFMLTDHAWKPESGHIPVVVSQKRASQLVNFPAPKKEAPAAERLSYVSELRKKASGATFTACYRNTASDNEIAQALVTAKEMTAKKNDATYQKPAYLLGLPDPSTCGPAVVVQDKRTASEKSYMDKQQQFDTKFGLYTPPTQQKITYEVVGIAPNGWADSDQSFSMGIKDIIMSLLMTQSFRFAVPQDLYVSLPNKTNLDTIFTTTTSSTNMGPMQAPFYAEFDNALDARAFAKEESCQYGVSGCEPKTKRFYLMPFGSNSIGLDEAKKATTKVLLWTIAAVGALAAIIAGLTIGRTIADGRRETAVFRAIGFKRLDISQIYTTYTLLLCVRIIIFSLVFGLVAALAVHHFLWVDTTSEASLALGVYSDSAIFSYIGISPTALYVGLAIFAAGLLGMIIPLARNVRRNPIADMRDE